MLKILALNYFPYLVCCLFSWYHELSLITAMHFYFSVAAKKWHWKARTSALHFAGAIPEQHNFK